MGGIASSALTWRLCCTHWRISAWLIGYYSSVVVHSDHRYRMGLDLPSLPLDALIFKAVLSWSVSKMYINGTGEVLTITMTSPCWHDILISEIRPRDIVHSFRDKRWTTHTVRHETNQITARKMQPRSLSWSRDTATSMAIGDGEGLSDADVVPCQSTSSSAKKRSESCMYCIPVITYPAARTVFF